MAAPEKAILDLIYLTPNGDDKMYIRELRLQNLDLLNLATLYQFVKKADSRKLERALPHLVAVAEGEAASYQLL